MQLQNWISWHGISHGTSYLRQHSKWWCVADEMAQKWTVLVFLVLQVNANATSLCYFPATQLLLPFELQVCASDYRSNNLGTMLYFRLFTESSRPVAVICGFVFVSRNHGSVWRIVFIILLLLYFCWCLFVNHLNYVLKSGTFYWLIVQKASISLMKAAYYPLRVLVSLMFHLLPSEKRKSLFKLVLQSIDMFHYGCNLISN